MTKLENCQRCGNSRDDGKHPTYWSLCIPCGRSFALDIAEAKLQIIKKDLKRDFDLEGYPIFVK